MLERLFSNKEKSESLMLINEQGAYYGHKGDTWLVLYQF